MRTSILVPVSALVLTACQAALPVSGGQYWQRVHASSATYTRGPKAQQILNSDIAACVVEMRELRRLNAIDQPFPDNIINPQTYRNRMNPDVPGPDATLYKEFAEYSEFDGCMRHKGWERVAWVPYAASVEARRTYDASNVHIEYANEREPQNTTYNRPGVNQ